MSSQRVGQVAARAPGKAIGLLWAGAVVILGVTVRQGWGDEWRNLLSDVYLGYDSTINGLVVGSHWAFAEAFVGGYTLAWLYNRIRPSAN
jgi:hypothetical protein